MKPFDPTKPYQQRCGLPAKILCDDLDGDYPICAKLTDSGGITTTARMTRGGRYYKTEQDSIHDLVNIPVKKSGWINIYPASAAARIADTSHIYMSRDDADSYARPDRIACVQITWEE
jgi:hypothetical protein